MFRLLPSHTSLNFKGVLSTCRYVPKMRLGKKIVEQH